MVIATSGAIQVTQGQIIAVDGKQLCHSYDTFANKAAIHPKRISHDETFLGDWQ